MALPNEPKALPSTSKSVRVKGKAGTPAQTVSTKVPTWINQSQPLSFNLGNVQAAANPATNPYLSPAIVASGGGGGGGVSAASVPAVGYGGPSAAATSGGGGAGGSTATGWASHYTPESLDGIINQHPEILAGDVLKRMGITSTGLAGQVGDEAGVAQLVATILAGQNGQTLNNNDTVNQIAAYMKNRLTPGGSTPDAHALVNALINAGPDSPLYSMLGLGSASGQTADQQAAGLDKAIYGVMNDQNGYTQQAIKNYLSQQQSDYARALATSPSSAGTYQDYLKKTALPSWLA